MRISVNVNELQADKIKIAFQLTFAGLFCIFDVLLLMLNNGAFPL